ncbi:MAG: CRISPR-associated endoribonuclease Cas6 [Nanopusillaceae archaeon]
MRILIKLKSLQNAKYEIIHGYIIQGFIYNLLKDTEFAWVHSYKGYKYFTFSNIFPIKDFEIDKEYQFIISSPNKKFILVLYKKLNEIDKNIKLGTLDFEIINIKKFDLELKFPWRNYTPIVLRKGKEVYISNGFNHLKIFLKDVKILKEKGFIKQKLNLKLDNVKEISIKDLDNIPKDKYRIIKIKDIYYEFKKGDNFFEWLEDLKRQSIEKYNLYTGKEFNFDEPLFDSLELHKEVSVSLRIKDRGDIIYKGSLWKTLNVKRKLDPSERKFYKFLMDTGLGSLNSLGFGFINPVKD